MHRDRAIVRTDSCESSVSFVFAFTKLWRLSRASNQHAAPLV